MKNDVASVDIVTTWSGGMASESCCRARSADDPLAFAPQHTIYSDQPEMTGGKNSAPNPQELILSAFNACMTAAFVSEAMKAGITLYQLEIQTSGELYLDAQQVSRNMDIGVPDAIRYIIRVSGTGSLSEFDKLHRQVISRSPNRWLLSQSMIVEGDLEVEPLAG